MNTIYKILIFIIFSFTIPIGKLFEIFVWQNNIIKIEYVVKNNEIESRQNSKTIFVKLYHKNNETERHNIFEYCLYNFEKYENIKSKLKLNTYNKLFDNHKFKILKRFMFNLIYFDENELFLYKQFINSSKY